MNKTNSYDIIIVGAGPAGLTAAIYASRANLKVTVFEKASPGGKLVNKDDLENYPGVGKTKGSALAFALYEQSQLFGATISFGEITKIENGKNGYKTVMTSGGETFEAKAIIIATGMKSRHLNVPGESEYETKGVSFCSVCDGALFKGKPMAIVGGGNSAIEAAIYVSRISPQVYLLNINKEVSGEAITIEALKKVQNVKIINEASVTSIKGDGKKVNGLTYKKGGKEFSLEVNAVFPYIGHIAESYTFDKLTQMSLDHGFVNVNQNMETGIEGIYSAGDINNKDLRQITTATADGTIAAQNAIKYINNKTWK